MYWVWDGATSLGNSNRNAILCFVFFIMWPLESDCSGMNYGYHQLGREIGAVSLLYNDILEATVLVVVLLRCRIFSTEEWRARLD
jgi:hypothetical protein